MSTIESHAIASQGIGMPRGATAVGSVDCPMPASNGRDDRPIYPLIQLMGLTEARRALEGQVVPCMGCRPLTRGRIGMPLYRGPSVR